MLPILLNLGPVKIYTFGVFLVLAFFWSAFLLWRVVRLSSYKEDDVFDMLFGGLISGMFAGRLIYTLLHFDEFGLNILKFILINGYPGLSLIGCIAGFIIYLLSSAYLRKIKFGELVDYFVPPMLLSIAIGKLGSFFSGAEIGTRTRFFLAVKYAGADGLRHLTPLYESILFFTATYVAYRLLFEVRKEKHAHSITLSFFMWSAGLIYFVFDNMKQYHLYFMGLSFNKIISGVILLTFSFYFVYYFRSLIIERGRLISNSAIQYAKKTYKRIFGKSKGTS